MNSRVIGILYGEECDCITEVMILSKMVESGITCSNLQSGSCEYISTEVEEDDIFDLEEGEVIIQL